MNLKQEIINQTILNYPDMEKQMETLQEYKEGCRQSDIRSLVEDEHPKALLQRIFNYGSDSLNAEVKEYLISVVVENDLIDSEEL